MAVALYPAWEKGYLRMFHALVALEDFSAAMRSVDNGLVHVPSSTTLQKAKQTLLELPAAVLQPRKQMRCSEPSQPTPSLQAALDKLQKAGEYCMLCLHVSQTW